VAEALRIAFDVGGVLSKYPETFGRMARALAAGGVEVWVVSDMPRPTLLDMLARNGLGWIPTERCIAADYAAHGEECKAIACATAKIDVLVDDFIGYVAVPGAPPVRLLVMPDASRPYYAPEWKTDGSEGNFGRKPRGEE
jgi:hypothetical protein